jgi:CRISPR-associated exonuclease Cas4
VVPPTRDTDSYPPLSALNDLLFCERRCFLHRVEEVWVENAHTVSGSQDHRRVHAARDAEESGIRTARGLCVVSHRLRVVGVCDLVEFHGDVPYPVEYKRGKRRRWDNNEVQLCAQAMALEEMLGVEIPAGALFFVKTKRRHEVAFDADLRTRTEAAAQRLRQVLRQSQAPSPVLHPKCKQCSLHSLCLPELISASEAYQRATGRLFQVSDDPS